MATNQRTTKNNTTSKRTNTKQLEAQKKEEANKVKREIFLVCVFVVAILLFLSNFGIIGTVGNYISAFLFGCMGIIAYIFPVVLVVAGAFYLSNRENKKVIITIIIAFVLLGVVGMMASLIAQPMNTLTSSGAPIGEQIKLFYTESSQQRNGGGVIYSILAYGMVQAMGVVGTVLILLLMIAICTIILTKKSMIRGIKKGSKIAYDSAKVEASKQRKKRKLRKEEQLARDREHRELLGEDQEEFQADSKKLRMEKKIAGVMKNPKITKVTEVCELEEGAKRYDMHEYVPVEPTTLGESTKAYVQEPVSQVSTIVATPTAVANELVTNPDSHMDQLGEAESVAQTPTVHMEQPSNQLTRRGQAVAAQSVMQQPVEQQPIVQQPTVQQTAQSPSGRQQGNQRVAQQRPYQFPPIHLLKASDPTENKNAAKLLRETAMQLEQTLLTFGVKVTVTDISQGPSVTRYELQPELGVKVSKIVGLADDIKLNLAATDIRIEAPIPGKAAVGIEVPNKENSLVALRDLFETNEFKTFDSNIAFAVGKDISGKTVVSDIGKMPHMLVAGATGSGKSVCINTLIMSVLYKAHPDDVKMIMIDPKVVELSVYNGIPHLMIPVVTDPKKAAAALHWGVAEMTDRYKKFADYNVRDLKGYNDKVAGTIDSATGEPFKKMPQIIIIVDELADLMMVAPGEVEESICRLAQLARAAGIHLIIATQRPSVDVITGLIKANMPSRVAFSVSSGVDSRTILDMNGAEKLLGKGDMLFYPQGYSKPGRVQGAFVSDGEVSDVVDFLKNQAIGNVYEEDITSRIEQVAVESSQGKNNSSACDDTDVYFQDAARFIIEKEKASIGMLQRVFKIGFNRAARIMDQLAEEGVVGEEEGTKPRKVLMSMEAFEEYIREKDGDE
ncbi:MAG: DNA translocase FtsK [Eubacteriales bacterium]